MLASRFVESGGVNPKPNGARSRLVTNEFLISLSQVFGWGAFTSRDVSNQLGLDFPNTSKTLSRMSKRSYYLLSAVHLSRPHGGYENSYTISTKGWSKITYLQGSPASALKSADEGGSILLGATRAQVMEHFRYPYLLRGKGTPEEYPLYGIPPKVMGGCAPITTTRQANVNQIITGLDWRFLETGIMCQYIKRSAFKGWELAFQVNSLEKLGLTPSDTFPPLYANAARYLGATDEEIIISLLARRNIELNKLLSLKTIELSLSESENRTLKLESRPREIKVQSSGEDESLHHASFLNELFFKIADLSSLTTDDYMKTRVNEILNVIMEHELSSIKRRLTAT